jgi:hypothetical protein
MEGKATIYAWNGKVLREFPCVKFEPYCGLTRRIETPDGKSIMTNCPVVVTGVHTSLRQPNEIEKEQTFDVALELGDSGSTYRRTWQGAFFLVHLDGIVCFWHGSELVCVAGPVIIENFKNE